MTLLGEIATLALRRLASRLADPAIIKLSCPEHRGAFLERHRAVVCNHSSQAAQRACLALEIAFADEARWERIAAALPREQTDPFRRQARALRGVFVAAGMGGAGVRVAPCLGDARRAASEANNMDEEDVVTLATSVHVASTDGDADEEVSALAVLAEQMSDSGQAPLADLLTCRSRYGELLLVGLADYFLCRALQADPQLGHDFVFIHLEQADELWNDDLGVLAEVIEQQGPAVIAALDRPAGPAVSGYTSADSEDAELERQFQRGLDRYLVADYEGAIPCFTAALRLDPECAPLYAYRGDAYRLLCEYDRAIADYSAALRWNPASAPVLAQRAAAQRRKGDLPQAIADASAALALDPKHATAFTCRADAQLALSAFDEAIADYTAAIELQPPTAWAQLGRGTAQLRKGNYDAAVADFTRVLALDPHQVSALLQRGDACRLKGDLAQAIVDYTEVLRHHPRNAMAYRHRAQAHERNGDDVRAILDFSRALRIDPTDAPARCSRGVLFRRRGNLPRALSDLDEVLRHSPKNETALFNRARISLARGLFHKALADLDAAINGNPNLIAAYLARALAHDRLRQFPQGIQNCGRALLLDKRCATAWLIRGVISSHAGHYPQAIADLTEAIALDPEFPQAYQERGTAHVLAGAPEPALADYTRLIALVPRRAVAYANRGIIYQLHGDHEAALGDFSHALRLDPQCMLAGSHQNLSDTVRDKTTRLLADYAEGIRPPQPRRSLAPQPEAGHRRPAAPVPADADAGAGDVAPSNTTIGEAPASETLAPSTRPRKPHTEIRRKAQETLEHIAPAALPTQTEISAPRQGAEIATEAGAAQELLTLDDTNSAAVASAGQAVEPRPAPAPIALPPLQCPLCREIGVPAERLEAGRVRCGNCKAVYMPTAASFLAAAPKSSPSAKAVLNKYKPKRATRDEDDDEPRFTGRQKLTGLAAAAMILLVAGYFFFPTFGGAGGSTPITVAASAEDLLRDFTINKVGAAKKYTLGYVLVSGEVAEVYRDKRPRIRFKGDDKAKFYVEAVFTHPNDLKEIEKGHKLTVRGECEGWQKNIVEITLCKAVEKPAP